MRTTFTILIVSCFCSIGSADYWTAPMQEVHAKFTGEPGSIARFGDSIFVSQAFFAELRYSHTNVSPESQQALDWLRSYLPNNVWGWQSPETGASGGKTSAWPLASDQNPPQRNIDHWLDALNPEMAIIMWGTNDLQQVGSVDTFANNMREVVQTAKENGTIPILTTLPPRHNYDALSQEFALAVVDLALEEEVPLIDFHQEIRDRAPGDTWDGALIYDGSVGVYQIERPVSGDGVHPSNPSPFRRNFSEEALSKSGFTLLNYLALNTAYDVYLQAIAPPSPALAGDYNDDGRVDAADYTVWRDHLGADLALPNETVSPGSVTAEDYEAWKTNFGALAQSQASAFAIGAPEPPAALLALAALSLLVGIRSGTRSTS